MSRPRTGPSSAPSSRARFLPALLLLAAAALAAASLTFAPGDGGAFGAARERGALRVGVPYLAEPVPAGGKVRTPEGLDGDLAARLAQDLGVQAELVRVPPGEAARALAEGRVDVALAPAGPAAQPGRGAESAAAADLGEGAAAPAGLLAVDTGYRSLPRPVMRSDTDIHGWDGLRGRVVCVADAAWAARRQAERSGAQVRTYPVPSDALVAVRTGQCDAGLVDEAMWHPLMSMPEWKKFSATLPVGQDGEPLRWLLPEGAAAEARWLARRMQAWRGDGVYRALAEQWARNVAFDVYLDQEVPDCHG